MSLVSGGPGGREDLRDSGKGRVQSLMKNLNVSVERAMTILDIPEGERQAYLDLLQKQ